MCWEIGLGIGGIYIIAEAIGCAVNLGFRNTFPPTSLPQFVAFADLHGMNTSILANLKLPTWQSLNKELRKDMHSWFLEPGSNIPLAEIKNKENYARTKWRARIKPEKYEHLRDGKLS